MLIDEGHDFAPEWLQLAVQMLDAESNSLLLLYDDGQAIYGANRSKSFSFRSVGIAAAGRTRILRRNYRSTAEILACARGFAEHLLSPVDAGDDGVPFEWFRDARAKSFDPSHPCVKLLTPHSSKGLQFRVVAIVGLGFWPFHSEADEARLLYVGMTRATHELVMSSCKPRKFSERARRLCEALAA